MKILLFADIHANFSSLKALVETKDFKEADLRIFLGDAVSGGASPDECIKLLNSFDIKCLMGNNDCYALNGLPNDQMSKQKKVDQYNYVVNQLSTECVDIMRNWDKDLYLTIADKKLYFVHYPWESSRDVVDDIDKNVEARALAFEDIDADYIIFAHEHECSKFENESKIFYTVPSLGLSKEAVYTLVDIEKGVTIENRSVSCDWNEERRLVQERYPECEGKQFVLGVIDWIVS